MKETPTGLLISSTRTFLPFWNSVYKEKFLFLEYTGYCMIQKFLAFTIIAIIHVQL